MEKKQKTLGNKGFSLVELIIVIAIMAVLVVVLAPQFIKFVEKGRESTDLQNITETKTAVETYVADKALAADDAEITVKGVKGGNITITNSAGAVSLAEYGVDGTTPMKSAEWDKDIVWKYEDYKWSTDATPAQAKYYDANGKELP